MIMEEERKGGGGWDEVDDTSRLKLNVSKKKKGVTKKHWMIRAG